MTEITTRSNGGGKYTWNEFSVHLVAELERFDKCASDLSKQVNALEVKIAVLQVKVGLWGFAGSAFGFLVMYAITKGLG